MFEGVNVLGSFGLKVHLKGRNFLFNSGICISKVVFLVFKDCLKISFMPCFCLGKGCIIVNSGVAFSLLDCFILSFCFKLLCLAVNPF
jgi:hypothetical protein